jgi:hypothetical protein
MSDAKFPNANDAGGRPHLGNRRGRFCGDWPKFVTGAARNRSVIACAKMRSPSPAA